MTDVVQQNKNKKPKKGGLVFLIIAIFCFVEVLGLAIAIMVSGEIIMLPSLIIFIGLGVLFVFLYKRKLKKQRAMYNNIMQTENTIIKDNELRIMNETFENKKSGIWQVTDNGVTYQNETYSFSQIMAINILTVGLWTTRDTKVNMLVSTGLKTLVFSIKDQARAIQAIQFVKGKINENKDNDNEKFKYVLL